MTSTFSTDADERKPAAGNCADVSGAPLPHWSAVFSAWMDGASPALVSGLEPEDSDAADERVSIDELTRRVMVRRLSATSSHQVVPDEWDIEQLDAALADIETRQRGGPAEIEETLQRARTLDIDALHRTMRSCAANFDIGDFILLYALPLMRRMGDLWAAGDISVSAEHLVSTSLAAALQPAAAHPPPSTQPRLKMLVATPYGELHELGAIAACRLAQSHGFEALYIGAQLPVYEMARLAKVNGIRIIVLGGSMDAKDMAMQHLRQLAQVVDSGSIIFTGGSAYEEMDDQRRVSVRHCRTMRHFCCQIETLAAIIRSVRENVAPAALD
ncbi:B12-binding domain-containing protein [Rhizobium sp. FKL33]|uniref:cobalamin B12-binding domain-containing protein n=1 Tax=Rhizobium sp. FKL33 TaxID=2562307 RepID=UPI0010C027D2|nr:B12-binding domain-containing protein [Rhizobium sp. FKL33]